LTSQEATATLNNVQASLVKHNASITDYNQRATLHSGSLKNVEVTLGHLVGNVDSLDVAAPYDEISIGANLYATLAGVQVEQFGCICAGYCDKLARIQIASTNAPLPGNDHPFLNSVDTVGNLSEVILA